MKCKKPLKEIIPKSISEGKSHYNDHDDVSAACLASVSQAVIPVMVRMFRDYPDVVTVEQLCRMLRIGRNTAYTLLRSGKLKSVRIGKKYIIPTEWIAEYLKESRSESI